MPAHVDHKDEFISLAIAVASIWAAVLAISVLSPDLVSGSEQQHLPVAAFGAWFWGTVATFGVLPLSRRGVRLHRALAVAVTAVWTAATGVAIFGPVMVTGTDPTRLPLCAILAPIVAALLTLLARAGVELAARALDQDDHHVVPDDTALMRAA